MSLALPPIPPLSEPARAAAAAHQARLTKPPGALGRLEELALWLAAVQDRDLPSCERARVLICAGDHGVTAQGISPYPQEVTAQMCLNFCASGAAVNALARQAGAEVEVVDVGVAADLPRRTGLIHAKVVRGTADFTVAPALGDDRCRDAIGIGLQRANLAADQGIEALILGEMGIGNTTSAAALMALVLGRDAAACCGRGTGIDDAGLARKIAVVDAGIRRHASARGDAFAALAAVGGAELAALAGACIGAAARRLPVVVDGFICTAAVLAAVRLAPTCRPYLVFAHRGAEQGHAALLDALDAQPLLDLGLRLGEGTGGVLALHLLRAACRTHGEMATFSSAGISDRA